MAESTRNTAAPVARHYSNIEVLDLVRIALMKGCADGMTDPIIPESWIALEHQFEAGRRRGYEVGRREGYEEGLAAAGMAEATTIDVIEGIFRQVKGKGAI